MKFGLYRSQIVAIIDCLAGDYDKLTKLMKDLNLAYEEVDILDSDDEEVKRGDIKC